MSSTEKVDYILDYSFGKNNENFSELISEAVFRSSRIAEVESSSNLFCKAEVVCLSQTLASIDFRFLVDFDFLDRVLLGGEIGIGNPGSISDSSGIYMGSGILAAVIAGATGIGDREVFEHLQ